MLNYERYSTLGAWDKSPLSDLCRIFSSVLRVLRANTGRYLTEKRVKWSERGGAKMVTGLLSQAPSTALLKYCSNECSIFVSGQGGGKRRCGASLIDDNAVLAQIVGAHCCDI